MTPCSYIVFTVYLSFILHSSHGFEVIQPQSRTVSSDGVASITCEHTANVTSVVDVRLNGLSLTDKPIRTQLCQKGMRDCKNISVYHDSHKKSVFFILNIGPEAMNMTYECEFTVKIDDLDHTRRGTPTILLTGEKEAACVPHPQPTPSSRPRSHQLRWILIGLLAVTFLYSCVITFFYIRLKFSNGGPENSTYVVMRKAPLPRNPHFDVYCGS